MGRPNPAAHDGAPAGADQHLAVAVDAAVDDGVGLEVFPDVNGGVFNVLGENAPLGADSRGAVAQNTLDHGEVAAGLHGAARFDDAAYPDASHGPDGEAGEHIPFNVHVSQEFDVAGGEVHVPVDIKHRLDLEAAPGKFHMAGHRGQQRILVLTELGVAPLGQGDGFSALGWDFLIQHRAARLALCGADQAADLLPFFHVMDQIQGGVVHLVELIYLQHPLYHPWEVVYDVAVAPIEGGLALGD